MEQLTDSTTSVYAAQDTAISQTELDRLHDVEAYTAPYHIHFMEGAEGHSLNPQGAEYNYDASIVLTRQLRERDVVPKSKDYDNPTLEWFLEKYPTADIEPSQLKTPVNTVWTWLRKMGPHNDMAEAEEDLQSARAWILEKKPGQSVDDQLGAKEVRLLAELDIELANTADDETRKLYLNEAIDLLESSRDDHLSRENYGYAATDQATLSSLKVELARQQLLGTRLLTEAVDPDAYHQLEDVVFEELDTIQDTIINGLDAITEQMKGLPSDSVEDMDKRYRDNMTIMFEALTYYSILSEVANKGALSTARVTMGTQRQEQSTTYKIVAPHQEKGTKNQKNFNFNYDIEYTQLNPRYKEAGQGLYETVYIQNKVNPDDAPEDLAEASSAKFFAGKEFKYMTPNSLLPTDTPDGLTYRGFMLDFATRMKDYASSRGE